MNVKEKIGVNLKKRSRERKEENKKRVEMK